MQPSAAVTESIVICILRAQQTRVTEVENCNKCMTHAYVLLFFSSHVVKYSR